MYKLHYPRLIVSMLKEPPISKMVLCSTRYETPRNHFKFEYLGEFEIEIKNILEHESRAHMGLIHEKNQTPKNSCNCTFYRKRKTFVPLQQADYGSVGGSSQKSTKVFVNVLVNFVEGNINVIEKRLVFCSKISRLEISGLAEGEKSKALPESRRRRPMLQ